MGILFGLAPFNRLRLDDPVRRPRGLPVRDCRFVDKKQEALLLWI